MAAVEEFARRLLDKYQDALDNTARRSILRDLTAGEYEVAVISTVETAPVTAAEIREFTELAASFTGVDAKVAPLVAEQARRRLAAA